MTRPADSVASVARAAREQASPGRLRRRLATVALSAAMICAPLPALAAPSAHLVDWGGSGWSDSGWGDSGPYAYGGSSSNSAATTVDSDPATDAESTGVVLIDTTLNGGSGAGTGIVLTAGGQVLTNYHVVEGATSIKVTVATTGDTYTADVVGHSATSDVALLQLEDASGLTPATVDDDQVATGDEVTAVGNAGGTGELTAADGSVTALESTITTASEYGISGETLKGLIETDADVVAGDSGGPLLDDQGEVIGIDTAASSGSEIDGYAIPIDDALAIVAQIRSGDASSTVQIGSKGFLGVQLGNLDRGYAQAASGAVVEGVVSGSAADQAGLEAGDVITAIDGTSVTSGSEVSSALASTNAGDRVKISWTTADGQKQSATVKLGESPTA